MLKTLQSIPSIHDPEPSWHLNAMTMDAWVDRWSLFADIHVLHPRKLPGHNFARDFTSENIAGARMMTGCQLVSHTKRHAELTGGTVLVQRIHAGFASNEFSDASYVHRAGFISITDELNEYRASHHRMVSESVWVPRERLGLSDLYPVSPVLVDVESPRGRLIAGELDLFFKQASTQVTFDSTNLELAVRSLLQEDLYPASDREEWWRGRKKLIRKYIETHLENPKLGPAQICNLFNMSRATLYRMFEDDGGVRRFIQDRRLYSAIWDLASEGIRRGRLSRVAEKWGFSSDANFNRAAKGVFGMPPGALFRDRWQVRPAGKDLDEDQYPLFEWFKDHRGVKHTDKSINASFLVR
ncbi:MAG: AraC family transcriptional regulator [Pseudomonadota bacterium]